MFRKVTSDHLFSLFPKGEFSAIYNVIVRIMIVLKFTFSLSLKIGLLSKLTVLRLFNLQEGEKYLLIYFIKHTSDKLLTILIYLEVSAQETC